MGRGLRPGDVIDGRYRVERVLGKGGMGVVVEATHLTLGTKAAIKVLKRLVPSDIRTVEHLVREAQLAARLRGEHVVRVFDVGLLDAGSPFVVMEHLEGWTLHEMLAARGPLPVAQAVSAILQVCDALAEAHALGIVHRDLKPANLFVVRQPNGSETVKVLDFGVAKLHHVEPGEETSAGAIVGTPQYMPPEQFASPAQVTTAGDIWALGVILYELLAGRRPFDGRNPVEVIWRVTSTDPLPLHSARADVPAAVAQIVARCLARDPAQRPASVAEVAASLVPFAPPDCAVAARHRAVAPPPPPPVEQARAPLATPNSPALAFTAPAPTASAMPTLAAAPARRRTGLAVAAVGAVVGLVAALGGVEAARRGKVPVVSAAFAPAAAPSRAVEPSTSTVVLRGSTTVGELSVPLGTALAAAHPGLVLRYEPSSSAAGLGALVRGEVELAASSRPATEDEKRAAEAAGTPLSEHVVARDGIAVIVHPDNPVGALDLDQLRAVLTGRTSSWSELGGRHARINVLVRPEEQGSHEVIKAAVFRPGDAYAESAEVVRRSEDVTERVRSDPDAIGYVTFLATGSTKALRLAAAGGNHVPPSAATIRSGSYPLRRELYVYARSDASRASRDVLAFLLGPGQSVVREAGFVPLEPR